MDVDAREHGQTALHLAASLGYPELVSLLLHCEASRGGFGIWLGG